MATYTENFTSGTLASWTQDSGTWSAAAFDARQSAASGSYRKLRYSAGAMDGANVQSQCDMRVSGSTQGIGAFVRGTVGAAVTYYLFLGFGGDFFYLVEITAGVETILATGSACTASTTYTAMAEANGSNIAGYRNGVLDASAVDSSLTGLGVGIGCYGAVNGTNDWADNWSATDIGGGAATGYMTFMRGWW